MDDDQLSRVFAALADPTRRDMVARLAVGDATVGELADPYDVSVQAVSKHVKVLHYAGFISIEDIGRERYCTLKQEGFKELQQWMDYFDEFWAGKLKKLETLLNDRANKK